MDRSIDVVKTLYLRVAFQYDTKRSSNKERYFKIADVKGVSSDNKVSGAQDMLKGIRDHWTGAALAAGLSLGVAFSPVVASAQSAERVTPVSADEAPRTAISREEELAAFDRAANAARNYAESYEGVGIVFHIGEDIMQRANGQQLYEKVARRFITAFESHGVNARVYGRPNPGTTASGVTYHIGNLIHGSSSRQEVKDLKEGLEAIPSAAEQHKNMVGLFAQLRTAPEAPEIK